MVIYNHAQKLDTALKGLETLDITKKNKQDIKDFLDYIASHGCSAARQVKYIYLLERLARWLGKDFIKASKDDIQILIEYIDIVRKDDYLNRILYNWELGDKDTFGIELTLNVLSCPKSTYGIGGIGAQSFSPHGSQSHLLTLNKAIQNLLPTDFLKQNKAFQYKPIKTVEEEQNVKLQVRKGVSDEISYNYLFTLNPELKTSIMPTQIPVVLPEGFYKNSKCSIDPDILDYHIGALLIQPNIDENIQNNLINLIKETGTKILRDIPEEYNVDSQGILRLAKSWARLQFKWKLDEYDFTKMKKELEGPFKEFFDLIEDTKNIGRTYYAPLTRSTNKTTLSIDASNLLHITKQLEREIGKKRFLKTILR